jgi:hypothetical protein
MRHFVILISFFFISCQTNSIKSDPVTVDSVTQAVILDTPSLHLGHDTLKSSEEIPYVWLVDFDKKTKKRNPNFKQEYLNVDTLINGLNQIHPNIILDKIKISGDTLFTEIKDSEYLGERIGSYGAFAYIDDVVINLTSLKNINFVKIDFEDGSHISQGTWSKKQYSDYKEVHQTTAYIGFCASVA